MNTCPHRSHLPWIVPVTQGDEQKLTHCPPGRQEPLKFNVMKGLIPSSQVLGQPGQSLRFCASTGMVFPSSEQTEDFEIFLFQHAPSLSVCCAIYHAIKIFWGVPANTLPQS